MNSIEKQQTIAQLIALFFGFFLQGGHRSNRPENEWVALPCCRAHSAPGVVASSIELRAVSTYTAVIFGASRAFVQALAMRQSQPAGDFLESAYRAPAPSAEDFLGQIDKSTIESPSEFLKGMGQKPDAP
jgi:hypothetical protein